MSDELQFASLKEYEEYRQGQKKADELTPVRVSKKLGNVKAKKRPEAERTQPKKNSHSSPNQNKQNPSSEVEKVVIAEKTIIYQSKPKRKFDLISFIAKGVVGFFLSFMMLAFVLAALVPGSSKGDGNHKSRSKGSASLNGSKEIKNNPDSELILPSGLSAEVVRRVVESQAYTVKHVKFYKQLGGEYIGLYLIEIELDMKGENLNQVIDNTAYDSISIRDQLVSYPDFGEIMFLYKGKGPNGQKIGMKAIVNRESKNIYNVMYSPARIWSGIRDRFTRFPK